MLCARDWPTIESRQAASSRFVRCTLRAAARESFSWIGHSMSVSDKHYLGEVPDEMFDIASGV